MLSCDGTTVERLVASFMYTEKGSRSLDHCLSLGRGGLLRSWGSAHCA